MNNQEPIYLESLDDDLPFTWTPYDDDDEEDERNHPYDCICEICLQNHPE